MRALSIRQPWAWAIIHAGKDIENRTWHHWFRGTLLIHASSSCTREEYEHAKRQIESIINRPIPPLKEMFMGGIIGKVLMTGCTTKSDSPWFGGPIGFEFKDATPLPYFRCRGHLGFFNVEYPHL